MAMSFLVREPPPSGDDDRPLPCRIPTIHRMPKEMASRRFRLESPAFLAGECLPRIYTRIGSGLSPPLRWLGVPNAAISLVLLLEAPMAQPDPWLHWAIFDIPASQGGLPAGIAPSPYLSNGARHGLSWGRGAFDGIGYQAPDPGQSHPWGYRFSLSALDVFLCLPAGASGSDLRAAMQGHVVGKSTLHVLPPVER
jgi:Raf kinase inhibitor-like YbhB/YbcL family protein